MEALQSTHSHSATQPARGRILGGVLALREARDLEQHVVDRFDQLDLPEAEMRVAVLGAVGDAYRIHRALPSERPLLPVLDALLASRVVRLRSRLGRRVTRVA
jgi:hypothetical protein